MRAHTRKKTVRNPTKQKKKIHEFNGIKLPQTRGYFPRNAYLADLRFVSSSNAKLLVAVEANVVSAVDHYSPYAKRCTDAGTHSSTDGSASYSADDQACTRCSTNLFSIAFHRAFSNRSSFVIDTSYIVAFDRHDLYQLSADVTPTGVRKQYPVK
jgi:hypothetical protein